MFFPLTTRGITANTGHVKVLYFAFIQKDIFWEIFRKQRLADPFAVLRRPKKEGDHSRCRRSHCLWKVLHLGCDEVKVTRNSQRRWKTSYFIHGLDLIAIGENAINNIEMPRNKPTLLIVVLQYSIKHIYSAHLVFSASIILMTSIHPSIFVCTEREISSVPYAREVSQTESRPYYHRIIYCIRVDASCGGLKLLKLNTLKSVR